MELQGRRPKKRCQKPKVQHVETRREDDPWGWLLNDTVPDIEVCILAAKAEIITSTSTPIVLTHPNF